MAYSDTKTAKKPASGKSFTDATFDERYKNALKPTRRQRKEFWMNKAFMEGFQWVHYNAITCRVDEVPREEYDDRVQATINRMWPLARTLAGKLAQRELVFEVAPSKADDANVRAARTSESIVKSVHSNHDWETKRDEVDWAILLGGTAAVSIDWDAEVGEYIGDLDDDAAGTPLFTGDTCESVHNITEFLIQPGAKDAETATWWIKVCAYPPVEVKEEYDLEEEPPADAFAGMSPLQQRLISAYDDDEPLNLTLVKTYYERPNKMCPKGRVATIINGKIEGGVRDWPFPWNDRLNLIVFRETPLSAQWWGETVLTMARPIQVAFNTTWSSIIEHIRKTGNAKLAVTQSNMNLMEEMTDEIGEIVVYTDGTNPPAWINPAQLPAYIQETPKQLSEQMDDIFGVHEVSRGDAPGRVDSAQGISTLTENDSTPLGRIIKDQARGWARIASMVLKLYEINVTEERDAIVRSPGLPAMTIQWTGKDLLGQTDVVVPADAIMPRTHAAIVAQADKLVQMGMITSLAQYLHVIEAPNENEFLGALAPAVEKARRENHDMRTGKVCIPKGFDNHQVHIEEHNAFRMSLEYELMPDNLKKIVDDHVDAHEMLAHEEMAKQVARAQFNPAMAAVPTATGAPSLAPGDVASAATPQGPGPLDNTPMGAPANVPQPPVDPNGAMGPNGQIPQ